MLRAVAGFVRAGTAPVVAEARLGVDALDQRTAQRHVQLLNAAADRQDREASGDGGADQRQGRVVALKVVEVRRLALAALIVAGMHVARAARHQQPGQGVEQAEHFLAQGWDQDGQRADAVEHGLGIAGRALVERHVRNRFGAGGDANDHGRWASGRGRKRSAITAPSMPQAISAAIPRGVPSVSNPTSTPETGAEAELERPHQRRCAAGVSGVAGQRPGSGVGIIEALAADDHHQGRHDRPQHVHAAERQHYQHDGGAERHPGDRRQHAVQAEYRQQPGIELRAGDQADRAQAEDQRELRGIEAEAVLEHRRAAGQVGEHAERAAAAHDGVGEKGSLAQDHHIARGLAGEGQARAAFLRQGFGQHVPGADDADAP